MILSSGGEGVLYRAIPAVSQDFGFWGLLQSTLCQLVALSLKKKIDCFGVYAVSAIFQPCNGGEEEEYYMNIKYTTDIYRLLSPLLINVCKMGGWGGVRYQFTNTMHCLLWKKVFFHNFSHFHLGHIFWGIVWNYGEDEDFTQIL